MLCYCQQRKRSDCGVACVAMVSGVDYQTAFDAMGFPDFARDYYSKHLRVAKALQQLGRTVQWKKFKSWKEIPGHAIVAVNHRVNRTYFHWVAFAEELIFDPNPRIGINQNWGLYRASGWYLLVEAVN